MGELIPLNNKIQNYAWGSHSTLGQMRGVETPTAEPEAELWVGAHSSAPSEALIEGQSIPLNELVAQNPDAVLPANRTSDDFPFLLKILAIDAPLSLQVHPTDEQAEAGYAAENAQGIALDDPRRNYKDVHSKPETVIALSDVNILVGVRRRAELLGIAESLGLSWLSAILDSAPATDKDLLVAILNLDHDAAAVALEETSAAAQAWHAGAAGRSSLIDDVANLVQMLTRKCPGNRGILVATVMNLMHLKPGDSAFTVDGQVHAYVSGTAIEIMNPSDNVLRAGLTPKHVAVQELIQVLREDQNAPHIYRGSPEGATVQSYKLWDERLSIVRVQPSTEPLNFTLRGTSTVLGVSGALTFAAENEAFDVRPTESLLHTGSDTPVTITGSGEAYIAQYV